MPFNLLYRLFLQSFKIEVFFSKIYNDMLLEIYGISCIFLLTDGEALFM